LEEFRAAVDIHRGEYDRRLHDLEAAEDLAALATRAAATASNETQARALAHVLARGVLGDDPDAESSELMIAVLEGMTRSEIGGLQVLAASSPSSAADVGPSAVSVLSDGTTTRAPIADAVVARLVARGLLIVEPPGFGGFGLSSLGQEALEALKDAEGSSG